VESCGNTQSSHQIKTNNLFINSKGKEMNDSCNEIQKNANLKQKQLSSIQAKTIQSSENLQNITSDLTAEKKALVLIERRYVRDEVGITEVEALRSSIKELENQLVDAERMNKLVSDALAEITVEIQQVEQNLIIAERDYVLSEKARIGESLNADANIRARLMEAYAAILLNPRGFNGNWTLFVTSIFTSTPNQIEIDSAIAAFKQ